MSLIYNTRDGEGNDIVKCVEIKKFKQIDVVFTCMCGRECDRGVRVSDIVSSNFANWLDVSKYVCLECSALFSLNKHSYIVDSNGIRLLNVREMASELQKEQSPPFRVIISLSQKKHLFFNNVVNLSPNDFVVNLENELIQCNLKELKELFLFVGCLQSLGCSKSDLSNGKIRYEALKLVGHKALDYLLRKLNYRQVQIPLHLSQSTTIKKEDAICSMDLILNRTNMV